jgi:hypothetical protein
MMMKHVKSFEKFVNESINEAMVTSKAGPFAVTLNGDDFSANIGKISTKSNAVPSEEWEYLTQEGGSIKTVKDYMAKIVNLSSAALKPDGSIKSQPAFEKLKKAIDDGENNQLFGAETYNGWFNDDGEFIESDEDYIATACYIVAKSTLMIDWYEKTQM